MSDGGPDEARGTVAALVWCPFPDEDAALHAIDAVLDDGLAACGNILPGVLSVFVWKGERDTAREVGVLLKTTADRLEATIARIVELHPYEEPAVVGWRCDSAAPGTLAWLGGLPVRD